MAKTASISQRTARWLALPVRVIFDGLTARQSDQYFCRSFRIYNAVFNRWPISLTFDNGKRLFRVEDRSGAAIFVGRRSRLPYYARGVRNRLGSLAQEYMVHQIEIRPGDLVVDVGANIGEFSMYVTSKGARTISVEPEALEFRCLTLNVARADAVCLNIALWSSEEQLQFYSKNDSGDSSLFEVENYSEVRRVQASTLRMVLEKHAHGSRVRLLKLEAEGAEPEILAGAKEVLHLVDYITVDVGPERGVEQTNTFIQVLHQLQAAGFELIGVSDKRMVMLFKNNTIDG